METKSAGREIGESGKGGLERSRNRFEIWKTGFDNVVEKSLEQFAGGTENSSGGISRENSINPYLINTETVGTKEPRKETPIHHRQNLEEQKRLKRDDSTSNSSRRCSLESSKSIKAGTIRKDNNRRRSVLMELIYQFNKSGTSGAIFNQLDKRWLDDDELESRLTETVKRAMSVASDVTNTPITEREHQLFEFYAGVHIEKARRQNEIRKRAIPELEKLFANRYKDVDEDVGLLWLDKSHEDIERAYSRDDPDELEMMKYLGSDFEYYYGYLRTKKIQSMKNLFDLLKNYKNGMFALLEEDVCNTRDTWIDSYHSKMWEVLTGEIVCANCDEPIVIKVIDEIKAVLMRENADRLELEKETVRMAVEYAVGKYCVLMENKLEGSMDLEHFQILHGKLKKCVIQSFYSVRDFTYTEIWKVEECNIVTRIEEEYKQLCDSVQRRIDRFRAEKEEAMSNIVTEFDLSFLKLLKEGKSETAIQTRVAELVAQAFRRLDSKYTTYAPELYARLALCMDDKKGPGNDHSEILSPEMETESPRFKNHETVLESISVATKESLKTSDVHYNPSGPCSKRKSHVLYDSQAPIELNLHPKMPKMVESPEPGISRSQSPLKSLSLPVIVNKFAVGSNSAEPGRECSVAMAFFRDQLKVQVHRCHNIEKISLPARFSLVQKDKALPYIDEGEFQDSRNFETVNAYELLIHHQRAKSFKEYFVEGHLQKLWSDELLALLLSKLRQKLQEGYGIDCTNQHIAFGIPETLSSACRQRLKTALELSGFPLAKLVHFTSAIAIYHSQVAQVEDTDPYHALAILMQQGKFDVAFYRHENMQLNKLAFSSFNAPVGTVKKETNEVVEKILCSAVKKVLKLGNCSTSIKYCRAVADVASLDRKNPDWFKSFSFRHWFNINIRKTVSPDTIVATGPSHEGIMEGLLHVSKHLGETEPPVVNFADRFTHSYFVEGSDPNQLIEIVRRNRPAQRIIKYIPVSDLKELKPPIQIVSDDGLTHQAEVIFKPFECTSPGAVMRIELTEEAILKLSFEDGKGQSLVHQPWWSVPHLFATPRSLESAQKHIKDILRLSNRWMSGNV